jgi:DNA-binding NtrC family response regulator
MSKPTILIVDDDHPYVETLSLLLKKDFDCRHVDHPEKIDACLDKLRPDIILLDIRFDGRDIGIEYIEDIARLSPVIMLTSHEDLDMVVESIKRGAHDYFQKDLRMEILKNKIDKCLSERSLRNRYAESIGEFLGESRAARQIRNLILKVSKVEIPVLITGESGVGKTLVARLIHAHSARADREMQVLAGPNLTDLRFESEAFGQRKGAYTDAPEKAGAIELADQSTLFIDEIGDLSPAVQGMFLKVLEDKKIKRMGEAVYKEVDFRLISATNHDLEDMIEKGTFRRDLYERICGIEINILPLRDRPGDIKPLFDYYLHYYASEWNKKPPEYDKAFLDTLKRYEWPGNVREVSRFAARIIMDGSTGCLGSSDVENLIEKPIQSWDYRENLKVCTDQFKRDFFRRALEFCDGNISKAAELTGVARPSLQRMLKELGIRRS